MVTPDIKLSERWFLNADIRYIDISSDVRLMSKVIFHADDHT